MWGETSRRLGGGRRRRGLLALPILALIVAAALPGVGHAQPSTISHALPQAALPVGANPANCPGGVLVPYINPTSTPHDVIVIHSDADFTAANGVTSGSGTNADPYVISCWSITVPSGLHQGISFPSGTISKAFTIRDVAFTGAAPGSGSFAIASFSTTALDGNVIIENVTTVGVSAAVGIPANGHGSIVIQDNKVDGGNNVDDDGVAAGSLTTTLIANNVITGVSACIGEVYGNLSVSSPGTTVQSNSCTGEPGSQHYGVGILLTNGSSVAPPTNLGSITATGNDVEGFHGSGLGIGGVTATNNIVRGNGTGIASNSLGVGAPIVVDHNDIENNTGAGVDIGFISQSTISNNTILTNGGDGIIAVQALSFLQFPTTSKANVVEGNDIERNGGAGMDISVAEQSWIRNNTILNNGSAGILDQPAQNHLGNSTSNLIDGNHVGGSPFGIVFAFEPTNNTVQNTDWVDGHPSFIRFSNSTTVVDAGSAQKGLVGQPTSFHDWLAQITPGSVLPSACTASAGCSGTDAISGVTGGTFNFGDGSPVQTLTPADLTNVATLLQHTYTAAGPYTATLTVNVTTNNPTNPTTTLTDTAPVSIAASSPSTSLVPPVDTAHWSELGNGPDRTFFQGTTGITKANVATLHTKWRFPTVYPVFASPAIADVNIAGSLKRMVFDGTYDGNVYGLDDATGLPIWGPVCIVTSSTVSTSQASCNPSFPGNTNAQVDYGTIIGSPAVATIGGSQRVFIAANGTLDALDAATGAVVWSFVGNATGAQFPQQTTCRQISGACEDTTYEMESSPVVVGNVVYIGMDCNGECLKGGGIYALDATDGHMLWFFDPAAGSSFVPSAITTPPSPVMAYNPKMNGPASGSTCGGIWTSPTIDVALGLLYASTANCQVNPLPPYMEAVFALHTSDGSPAWQNQPRPIDALDMDFGATPNVFHLGTQDVVGAASKDGTYTLYDAAGGTVIWSTKAALGGAFGGFYNSVTDGTKIYLSSAIGNVDGFSVTPAEENQRGRQYALDARTGNVMWRQLAGPFNIGQNSAVPGIYLTGGLDHLLHAWDADTGAPLAVFPLAGAASGTPVVAGSEVYIGAGTGATYRSFVGPSDPLGLTGIQFPSPIPIGEYGQGIYAFCLAQDVTCPATTPTPTVPEAPRAVLMPLVGGGAIVLAFAAPTLWRRRRARAAR